MRAKAFIMVILSCVVSNSLANQSPSLPPPSITLSQTEPRSKATRRDPFSLPSPESEKAQVNEKKIPLIKTSNQTLVAELTSELITLKYAQVSDLVELIDGANMLSERGLINADERTNTMLVRDLPIYINAVKQIVRSLDVAVKQVQIEARIVTVDEGQLEELGVRWGLNQNNNSRNRIAGGIEVNNLDQSSLDDRLNVNLGATSVNAASVAFQLATLGSDVLLDLELSAMQTEAKAEVISRPKLMTTNKQAAYIEQGSEIPYFESSENGASSVAFKKAVLSLKVTPQILSDDRLILDLSVTQDRPGNVVKTGSGEAVAINTQRIDTQVLVNNGQTVVLGGIYQHSVTDAVDKVPLFGDLPLIGSLFRRSYQNIAKSELLIFVTPTIVTE